MSKVSFLIAVTVAMLLTSMPAAHSESPDWNAIKRNPFIVGQLLGCLWRIEVYAQSIEDEHIPVEDIDNVLSVYLGDVSNKLDTLIDIGEDIGMFSNDSARDGFEEAVKMIANEELENNLSWLQALTCLCFSTRLWTDR